MMSCVLSLKGVIFLYIFIFQNRQLHVRCSNVRVVVLHPYNCRGPLPAHCLSVQTPDDGENGHDAGACHRLRHLVTRRAFIHAHEAPVQPRFGQILVRGNCVDFYTAQAGERTCI